MFSSRTSPWLKPPCQGLINGISKIEWLPRTDYQGPIFHRSDVFRKMWFSIIELLERMFKSNPEKLITSLKDNCSGCGREITINITPTSGGFGLNGGFLSKCSPDNYIMKCHICHQEVKRKTIMPDIRKIWYLYTYCCCEWFGYWPGILCFINPKILLDMLVISSYVRFSDIA